MLIELSQDRLVTFRDARFWGAAYQDFVGEHQRLVGGGLSGDVLPPGGHKRALRAVLIAGGVAALVALVSLSATVAIVLAR